MLENVTFGLFAEVQRLATAVRGTAWSACGRGYVGLRGLRSREPGPQFEMWRHSSFSFRSNGRWPSARIVWSNCWSSGSIWRLPTMSARVIAADATPYFLTLTVDRGTEDGIRSDLAVLAPTGVVGRVVGQPAARAARVQLLIDRNAAAGALIERTRASGVVMGEDDETSLRMEYVSNLETVWVGDRIVTSGIDGIYPKGFAIGTVTDIAPGVGPYQTIQIAPAVDFSQLEDVLVVMNDEAFRPREAESE